MQEEYNKRPMVDVLSQQMGRQVVMSGNQYVYMDTKASLEVTELEVANKTLAKEQRENLINEIEALTEQTFSKTAKEWGYISIERAISYQGSTNSVWHTEATTFRKWRDDVITYFLNSYYVSEMVLKDILPTKEEFLLNIPKIGE